ncbi:hypothetical protein DPMN_008977 [Dreissena polymorpha]|uniref:Uncharacterized protein n=1 Tax=Dreissena polymorpha TaxID=45954 RepID=A0A9D4MX81_DREPO|nr:hypothetical protein DPMN_008977 [Dreissena polymorpha]
MTECFAMLPCQREYVVEIRIPISANDVFRSINDPVISPESSLEVSYSMTG